MKYEDDVREKFRKELIHNLPIDFKEDC